MWIEPWDGIASLDISANISQTIISVAQFNYHDIYKPWCARPGTCFYGPNTSTRTSVWMGFSNTLAHGKFERKFRHVIFKHILVIGGWGIFCEIAPLWMSLDFTDDESTLVQVMAWCREATSHYLSQCWPRSLSPYGVTRPQWVTSHSIMLPISWTYGHVVPHH